jgi:hypothetical protein
MKKIMKDGPISTTFGPNKKKSKSLSLTLDRLEW